MKKRLSFVCVALLLLLSAAMITSVQVRAAPPWTGYVKPSFTDYAPSGMPDFDEKQDAWGPINPVSHVFSGTYTWCVPTAVADILWWLDSKGETLFDPSPPVAPPTISDHCNLIPAGYLSFALWDDHDPNMVWGLPPNLALLMDTDGLQSHDGHAGTRWTDVQNGTLYYLKQQNVANYFTFDNSSYPSFAWINNETQQGAGVVISLAFWQLTAQGWSNNAVTTPGLTNGHAVAIAGSDNTTNQLLVSDPWQNAYESGLVGGREPVTDPQPGNTSSHDDAQYVSQDAYTAVQYPGAPPPLYPPNPWELQGYLQTMGFDPSYHAFIMGAMALSLNPPQNIYTLNLTVTPAGSGVVALNYSGPYSLGDVVNLTAIPSMGYNFGGWSGNASGYANSTTVAMTGNETVTATFTQPGTHDIAVTSVVPAKTVVGQGYGLNVTSVVTNLGNYSESFNYTISLDGPLSKRTDVSSPSIFGVPAGNSTTIITVCNTTGIAYGNYTVTGHASIIPGETNTSNNDLSDGQITVTIPGDINGSFNVTLADLVLLANAYGTNSLTPPVKGQHQWNPNADINNDGVVGLADLVILATHYGKHTP